ncbi:MAG: peptide/nickel transport system substrate-binding protein [Paracoccaceae bacterium]|jgi:peptide/nickel transport system substrate-binding protein
MTISTLLRSAALAALMTGPAFAAGSMTLGMQLEPPNLDPTSGAAAAIDEVVFPNLFEGLVRVASDGSITPGLAKSWDISADGLTYTFHLVAGAKFHDGADFDASDVEFSFARAMADDSTNAQKGLFEAIDSVEVMDPATVKITLKRPTSQFLFNMGWGDAVIVDPASADTNATAPVGTGAFKFAEWKKGDSVKLVKNPDYWGTPAQLDAATWKFISDPTAAMAALMAGDVDAFVGFPSPETVPVFQADPRFVVNSRTTEGETILAINNKRPPFDNLMVRQAIAYAIDRQAIIDGAMFGMGTPIGSHFAPHHPAYTDLTGMFPHDPAKAKALLAEAGFPDGIKATIKLPPPSYARRGGEIVAAQLREVGIDLEIQNVEWAQWLEQAFKGKDFDFTIVSHTEPFDIGIYARPEYYFQYDNPDFQALMTAINAETDDAARTEMLHKAQETIAKDAVNGYLFQLAVADIWSADLTGWKKTVAVQSIDLTGVSRK